MADTPVLHITLSLTSPTFRFSDADSLKPSLTVTTTLRTPSTLTLDGRGERDSDTILGTILEPSQGREFRVEHFDFYDKTISEPVVQDLFPGTCEPDREEFVELHASKPHVACILLHENHPFADPIYALKPGHEYRITLRPQTIMCWAGSIDELLARKELVPGWDEWVVGQKQPFYHFPYTKYPNSMKVTLACDEELVLKIEA